jgi:hypothetical protein
MWGRNRLFLEKLLEEWEMEPKLMTRRKFIVYFTYITMHHGYQIKL